jgi:4-hydroxy-tetrahydrodipicolinate synthase
MKDVTFRGSYVALVTPFRNDEVDEAALRSLVDWHIAQGSHGLVPVGTTGESPTLSESEHQRVIDLVVDACGGRVPVIAGAGSNNTREAIGYTRYAAEIGADAALHGAGYYNRPSQEGLYQHFKALHDATDLPIIVYNIPPGAIVDIRPETMARIAMLTRVVGVEDATGDLARPMLEQLHIKRPFCYFSGDDATAVAYNVAGGTGCISVTANVAPYLCAAMQRACLHDNYRDAIAIQRKLMPLHQALFAEPSPAGVKYAVSLLGHCEPECRLPIVPLSDATKATIRSAMSQLKLI